MAASGYVLSRIKYHAVEATGHGGPGAPVEHASGFPRTRTGVRGSRSRGGGLGFPPPLCARCRASGQSTRARSPPLSHVASRLPPGSRCCPHRIGRSDGGGLRQKSPDLGLLSRHWGARRGWGAATCCGLLAARAGRCCGSRDPCGRDVHKKPPARHRVADTVGLACSLVTGVSARRAGPREHLAFSSYFAVAERLSPSGTHWAIQSDVARGGAGGEEGRPVGQAVFSGARDSGGLTEQARGAGASPPGPRQT